LDSEAGFFEVVDGVQLHHQLSSPLGVFYLLDLEISRQMVLAILFVFVDDDDELFE